MGTLIIVAIVALMVGGTIGALLMAACAASGRVRE